MSGFLAISNDQNSKELINKVSSDLGYLDADVIAGTPANAIDYLKTNGSPRYLLIDIASNAESILLELDQIAQYCNPKIKVIVIGDINDLTLYRELLSRGILEYFVKPVEAQTIKETFLSDNKSKDEVASEARGRVISFLSAASGDGSTTVSTNIAYMLANETGKSTVLVDMDYQFGLVARNLDLSANAGLKDLYEHPEGSIDQDLIDKTSLEYKNSMNVISAPRVLGYTPEVTSNMIANLIFVLRKKYDYVILDLPHLWADWMSIIFREADKSYIVAQLNIKSLTHTTRFIDAIQISGAPTNNTHIIVNRSGSKLKEPITSTDFSMACKKKIDHYISNDSKTVSLSEDQGITAVEINNSMLNKQFQEIADSIINL